MRGQSGTGSLLCAASEINCTFSTVERYKNRLRDGLVSAGNIVREMF